MSDNWLATLGSWLATPAKIMLAPWWDQLVEKKAEDAALRARLLEAIVRFRVSDFGHSRGIDSDKAIGISKRVVDLLKAEIAGSSKTDPACGDFLKRIESEIQICSVPQTAWVQLACLAEIGDFNPKDYVAVEFVTDDGTQSHGTTAIYSLQSSYPFSKVLKMNGMDAATLSREAIDGLKGYCSRNTLPDARFEISECVPDGGFPAVRNPAILSKAWQPKA